VTLSEDNTGMRRLLDMERTKNSESENKNSMLASEKQSLLQKLTERDNLIRTLESQLDERDVIIKRQSVDKEKVKEKLNKHDRKLEKKFTETAEYYKVRFYKNLLGLESFLLVDFVVP